MNRASIVIGTYKRERVLVEALQALLALPHPAMEILVVDQTPSHDADTTDRLRAWSESGAVRWLRLEHPSTVAALNRGLIEARGEVVLILDDDIVPSPDLVAAHEAAHESHPDAWAVVGQILQPGESAREPAKMHRGHGLGRDLEFPFYSTRGMWVENVMAGNLSVNRDRALAIGGFDGNFVPPVAFRFETEFAKRVVGAGGRIWFEPGAGIRHLRSAEGGTRSCGGHLASPSPIHGVGDYYYAMLCGRGWDRAGYILRRPFRQVRTRYHLRHPWAIPVKAIGELRALIMAWRLMRGGPKLLSTRQ